MLWFVMLLVILIISLIVIYDKFIKPTFENCFEQQPHEEPQPNQNIYIFLDKKEIEEEQEETEEQEEQEKNPEDEFVEKIAKKVADKIKEKTE